MMHRERLYHQLSLPGCTVDLATGFMETHRWVQHWVGNWDLGRIPPPPPGGSLDISDLFSSGGKRSAMPHSVLPGSGLKLDLPPGPLLSPEHEGYNSHSTFKQISVSSLPYTSYINCQ